MQGRAGEPDVSVHAAFLRLPRQGRAQQAGGISHRRCREGKGSQGEMSPACLSFSPQAHQPRFGDRRDPHVPGVLLGGCPRSPAAPRRGLVPVKPSSAVSAGGAVRGAHLGTAVVPPPQLPALTPARPSQPPAHAVCRFTPSAGALPSATRLQC